MADAMGTGEVTAIILALGVVTYMTRAGGYAVLSRFRRIPPRVEAALQAVPAAVITTLVVPPALSSGVAELLAVLAAAAAALRLPPIGVVPIGLAVLIAGRSAGL